MINRDCKTCAFSAYCATLGADIIFSRLRKCRECGKMSYIDGPDMDNVVRRRKVDIACVAVVEAWMLRGDVERVVCPECGEVLTWKIKPDAIADVINECKEMEGFELNEK